ncbi:Sensory/regulatory protein RpfC [Tepidimonas alkaliphilus]|uniref:Virulence sensor protein BvgS n=1 Tax=Tepidimonas alkaliphilus TaxID=2588942 RepID=A0A554W4A8_9BURK|nr:response regulator [Tepidimonas alkaliphilus]TSE18410.1 Sensory/regulatory protein RpfC [Tepidimonas alkaliphilus]
MTPPACPPAPPPARSNRRFWLWLALTTALLAAGMAVLLAVFLRQAQTAEDSVQLQADSLTALAFYHEREFLRLREEVALALQTPTPDWEGLHLRLEIWASRVALLRANPSTQPLHRDADGARLLPQLEQLMQALDTAVAQQRVDALRQILPAMQALGPDVQALTALADARAGEQVRAKLHEVRTLRRWVVALMAAQVVVLLTAAIALAWHQQRQLLHRQQLDALNDALRQARDAAEAASRAKSRFLANMSHELRTPFNGLLGMLTMLEASPLSPEQHDQIRTARASAEHLLQLLNDILDLSALDAGQMRLRLQPVDVPALVLDVQRWVQPQARAKGLTLQLAIDVAETPRVLADPTRIRQILLNLLGNAIKFTDRGSIELKLQAEPIAPERLRWRATVRDSGIGIDPAMQSRLFQRFQQADPGSTRRYSGSGLGLDIARSLARLMGGDVVLRHSAPGQGSTFEATWVTDLAAPPVNGWAADAPPQQASEATAPPTPCEDPPCAHVLVAEDHPVNRKVVGLMLQRLGHRVTFAADGAQALDLAAEQDFDLILMDVHMPVLDGLEATRRIRALPGPRGQVPIVALTADVLDAAQTQARAAGMNDFLGKPVQPDQLQATVRRWQPRQAATSPAPNAAADTPPSP